jgi:hypothetical protein
MPSEIPQPSVTHQCGASYAERRGLCEVLNAGAGCDGGAAFVELTTGEGGEGPDGPGAGTKEMTY